MADALNFTTPTRSYSVEVPSFPAPATDPSQPATPVASTYIRLGYPDQTSSRELAYYGASGTSANAATWNSQKPGVVMWSPSDMNFVAKSTTSFTTSEETLKVVNDANKLLSSAYTYLDGKQYRDVSYKLSNAVSWSAGVSQSWKVATNADFALNLDQKISLGSSFSAKASIDAGVAVGLMDVKASWKSFEVKSAAGDYALKKSGNLSGSESVKLSVSPIVIGFNLNVDLANKCMIGVTTALGVLGGASTFALPFGSLTAVPDATSGKIDESCATALKDWSKGLSGVGFAEMTLLLIAQALYLALGSMAVIVGKTITESTGPMIEISPLSIKMSTPFSSITVGPAGIEMKALGGKFTMNGPSIEMQALKAQITTGATSVVLTPSSIALNSVKVDVRGAANINLQGALVRF